ncbi:dihydropteroate synthase [Dokdonella immobilis]|uniref:Dihydropteroate synthase n=1 Tax=Dokdonella immobilis TaxID=578942 RepID=A0A1I4V501_9GAMM|nr:dihydropteroate synthase [Dokdonella immobilis]SFM96060.1 Dihydropteroate synthase [Dokdonella immobilis]
MFSPVLDCKGRELVLDQARICGIVNVTPDSFSDGGRFLDPAAAVSHALRLVEEGADMLDFGAESTRPGASAVSAAEQIARVIPVIEAVSASTDVPLSIDTSEPEVMRAAVAAGAGFINDVRALRADGALEAAADLGAVVCLMHMQGEPRTMQDDPHYDDVVGDVHRFLSDRVFACQLAGIDKKRIVVDPGFGFGKSLENNVALLNALERFTEIAPVMAGLSRKSMIGRLTGRDEVGERLYGSLAAAMIAAQRGALLIRVHDVAATRDVLAVSRACVRGDASKPARSMPAGINWDDD